MHTRFLVLVIYALVVSTLMIMPDNEALSRFPLSDKWAHGLIFIVFGMLSSWTAPKKHVTVVTGSIVFAGLTELVQWYLPYRRFEMGDFLADSIGILVGFASYQLVRLSRRGKGASTNTG